jgi:hypothetical protein
MKCYFFLSSPVAEISPLKDKLEISVSNLGPYSFQCPYQLNYGYGVKWNITLLLIKIKCYSDGAVQSVY